MGLFDRALERAGALEADEWTQADLLRSIAVHLVRANRTRDALAVVEKIRHGCVKNTAHAEVAAALAGLGDLDAAQESLRRHQFGSLYSDPYCEAAGAIAVLHAKLGQVERAFQAFQELPDSKFTAPTLAGIARALTGTEEAGRAAAVADAVITTEMRAAGLERVQLAPSGTRPQTASAPASQ